MQKTPRIRSAKYLNWIREQPCINCMAPPPSDPHHIKGTGGYSGAGLTAPDHLAMPLCRRCHNNIHAGLWKPPIQWEWVARTFDRAINEGVISL